MSFQEFIRKVAAHGEQGMSWSDCKALALHWRNALRMRVIEQVGTGAERRYRLTDHSIVDALAPEKAANVRDVHAAEEDEELADNDGGAGA